MYGGNINILSSITKITSTNAPIIKITIQPTLPTYPKISKQHAPTTTIINPNSVTNTKLRIIRIYDYNGKNIKNNKCKSQHKYKCKYTDKIKIKPSQW